jgi:hypothetical protein
MAKSDRWAIAACATLLAIFAALSWMAVRTKSPTVDETLHAADAYVVTFDHDFRINPEDPPLWKYWAMVPHHRGELITEHYSPLWDQQLQEILQHTTITTRWLYQTPGNDGIAFIQRSRAAMLAIGVALGAVLAIWSWQLAGAVGAVVATFLFSFDPNFIAHAPLVNSDVAITLLLFGLSMALYSVGRKVAWWNAPLIGLLAGAGMATKFSGLLLPVIVIIAMLARAVVPGSWSILRWKVNSIGSKAACGIGLIAMSFLLAWVVVWASYGFRFDPTPTPNVRLSMENQASHAIENEYLLKHGTNPTPSEMAEFTPSLLVRGTIWAEHHRLMPHAWLVGLMFTHQSALVRGSYLLGEHSVTGWWYYFPLAMLVKTPLAVLIAAAASIGLLLWTDAKPQSPSLTSWARLCIFLPIAAYGLSAVMTNLNLGLRHVLPLYPFVYLLMAIAAARIYSRYPGALMIGGTVFGLGLMIETLAAFPNYISFFNAPAKPFQLKLLSDSNLDWGQDLPALADWLRKNPPQHLYLGYFGTVDPAAYGIDQYTNLPGGFWLGPPYAMPDLRKPGVIAISANLLQGNNIPPGLGEYYARLQALKPRAVLGGGSIYVYDFPTPSPR